MVRVFALSFMLATLAVPLALAAGPIDAATLTCKDLDTSSHSDMLAMDNAVREALKNDPRFSSLSLAEFTNAEDEACARHPDGKVIDAMRADN